MEVDDSSEASRGRGVGGRVGSILFLSPRSRRALVRLPDVFECAQGVPESQMTLMASLNLPPGQPSATEQPAQLGPPAADSPEAMEVDAGWAWPASPAPHLAVAAEEAVAVEEKGAAEGAQTATRSEHEAVPWLLACAPGPAVQPAELETHAPPPPADMVSTRLAVAAAWRVYGGAYWLEPSIPELMWLLLPAGIALFFGARHTCGRVAAPPCRTGGVRGIRGAGVAAASRALVPAVSTAIQGASLGHCGCRAAAAAAAAAAGAATGMAAAAGATATGAAAAAGGAGPCPRAGRRRGRRSACRTAAAAAAAAAGGEGGRGSQDAPEAAGGAPGPPRLSSRRVPASSAACRQSRGPALSPGGLSLQPETLPRPMLTGAAAACAPVCCRPGLRCCCCCCCCCCS